jgi:hypothetical protein
MSKEDLSDFPRELDPKLRKTFLNLKQGVLEELDGEALSSRQIAEKLDIRPGITKFNVLAHAIESLERGGKPGSEGESVGADPKIKLAIDRRGSYGKHTFRYYRADQEEDLIQKGILSPEFIEASSEPVIEVMLDTISERRSRIQLIKNDLLKNNRSGDPSEG